MSSSDEEVIIERLRRRYDRERRARLEAEAIAEQGLRNIYAANQSLDMRIAERTKELEESVRLAEAATEAKSRFLAHIGHELRTPISGVVGMLELLEGAVTTSPAQQWLASAQESGTHLQQLFDRILWYIELETADLTDQAGPMPVEGVLDEAAGRWRQPCASVGQLLSVDLAVPIGASVQATEELHWALDEMLDNVVRHAVPGAVRLGASAERDRVKLAVEDSGPGVHAGVASSVPELFDPGEDPSTRYGEGAGIGLALVRSVAAALGGSFRIEQADGGGSIVSMTLPAET